MAAEETPVLMPASVKAEFYDEVFENGLPDMEKVEKEVENAPPKRDIEALLEELFESEPAVTMSSEVAALPPEAPKKAAGDSSDKEDEELEDESLVKHYLQVVKPTVNSKLHLPLPEYRINALGASRTQSRSVGRGATMTTLLPKNIWAPDCVWGVLEKEAVASSVAIRWLTQKAPGSTDVPGGAPLRANTESTTVHFISEWSLK